MSENVLMLLNEIERVGKTERWNSSQYLEGSLRVNITKDGIITDSGMYILSKNKLGYPSVVRVLNLNSVEKEFKFIISPAAQPIFKSGLLVSLKELQDHNIFFKNKEFVGLDSPFYSCFSCPDKIYKYTFERNIDRVVKYDFYSDNSELNDNLTILRFVIIF